MRFSSKQEEEDSTKRDLIKLATTLEQGPLAGKAPKTVAACTMHLYCRHTQVWFRCGCGVWALEVVGSGSGGWG